MYCPRFDATVENGEFQEPQCGDPSCEYCAGRPALLTRDFCIDCKEGCNAREADQNGEG